MPPFRMCCSLNMSAVYEMKAVSYPAGREQTRRPQAVQSSGWERDRNDSLSAIFVFSVCQCPLTCLFSILLTLSCQCLPSLFTLSSYPSPSLPLFLYSTLFEEGMPLSQSRAAIHPRLGVGQRLPLLFPPAEYSIR